MCPAVSPKVGVANGLVVITAPSALNSPWLSCRTVAARMKIGMPRLGSFVWNTTSVSTARSVANS
jgi:hypothetical protein